MLTRTEFEQKCDSFSHSYSSFLIIGAAEDQVIEALNSLAGTTYMFDPEWQVVNGRANDDGSIAFDICRMSEDFVEDITRHLRGMGLDVTGYADEAWDYYGFAAFRNGKPFNGFTAAWEESHGLVEVYKDGTECWEAHFVVTDNATGITFASGAGALEKEDYDYFAEIVEKHLLMKAS